KYDLLKSPDHFNRAKNAVESINRYVEDRDKKAPGTPPPVQNQTPPPAVFVKPEPQKIPGTQDNGKSAGSVAPVPSNDPPVGALQVPLPVVDPGKSGPKEQPAT
ncbi:hypothetical protein, partial [Aeromonas veronii]|uniref:hypothetical protein n=1 Tax=Aeromonas veronii TaxID=654 RepID=UPI00406CC59D